MITKPNNTILIATANVNPGRGQTTINYEWKLNNVVQPNISAIQIDTSTLNIGNNILELRAQNLCGRWSDVYTETINVYEATNMSQTILTAVINSPTQTINAVLNMTSLVTINVTDQLGQPVGSASVTIGTNPAIQTNLSGVATLPDVPYGEQTITITK